MISKLLMTNFMTYINYINEKIKNSKLLKKFQFIMQSMVIGSLLVNLEQVKQEADMNI